MRLSLVCALALGCFNPNPPLDLPCTPGGDCPPGQNCIAGFCMAGTGPPVDGGIGCESWQSVLIDPCRLPEIHERHVISSNETLDTTNATLTGSGDSVEVFLSDVDGAAVTIVLTGQLEIGPSGRLEILGDNPAILAAWGAILIEGGIDVSGIGKVGAGSNVVGCTPDVGIGGLQLGGPGGSRGGIGGSGGGNVGSPGVAPTAFTMSRRLEGGCSGLRGTDGLSAVGGNGGPGGGALALTSRDTINVSGVISANGAGGSGGGVGGGTGESSGGGGGGSGGHLILEAAVIDLIRATLVANGGGGGGGGGSQVVPNPDGQNGREIGIAAQGGVGGSSNAANSGGDGSAGAQCNGQAGGDGSAATPGEEPAGGGGGGACGVIETLGMTMNVDSTISPALSN